MHQAISINTLCLGAGSLDTHVAQVGRLGAAAIGLTLEEVDEFGPARAGQLLRDAGLTVATLTHRAFAYVTPEEAVAARARLDATIAVAETIGAQTITMTTGGRGDLRWSDAAARFVAEIAPCAERARQAGVILSPEPTSHLYSDVSILHRLADTVALSRAAGIGAGIDIFACWTDADIEDAIADAGPIIALVQVSDYVFGDRGLPCRAVLGDGAVPLRQLIPLIVETGFRGFFDIEVIGPRLDAEGPEAGLRRGAAHLTEILQAAGR